MEESLADFLRHLAFERNASAYTVKSYREDLNQALAFFREHLQTSELALGQLSPRLLRAYVAWLHGEGYAKSTMARRIAAVRSWCRYLHRQGKIAVSPAEGLRPPRQDKTLPHFMPEADLTRLMQSPTKDGPLEVRDRALLETLYSAGLRVGELAGLDLGAKANASGLPCSAPRPIKRLKLGCRFVRRSSRAARACEPCS
jgi:integrase/recombinase XerC